MYRIGIVGSEAAKFTKETEEKAKNLIKELLIGASEVVSGACRLGGVDIWAVEIGKELRIKVVEFKPKSLHWEQGYKPRNIQIAKYSDKVYCITVKKLPESYIGMRFGKCYHCNTTEHIKSGGCWTVKQAQKLGKFGKIIVI